MGIYAYASTMCVEVERQSAGVSFPFTVWVLGIELTQIVRVYGKVLYPPIHLENPLYFWHLGSDVSWVLWSCLFDLYVYMIMS